MQTCVLNVFEMFAGFLVMIGSIYLSLYMYRVMYVVCVDLLISELSFYRQCGVMSIVNTYIITEHRI